MPSLLVATLFLLAEEAKLPPIMRMDGRRRAIVLSALAGLIILGFLMIALTWLGARMTRRYMGPKLKPLSSAPARDEEWTRPAKDAADEDAGPRNRKG